ncbi:MAG: phosphotransferase [Armatimonadetes bacterium]|nr:phosphotransferase [Armatimonadota bacterium]
MAVLLKDSPQILSRIQRVAAYPDALTFREALQNPAAYLTEAFDLNRATVAADRWGLPLTYTGRFAVVFRLMLPGNVAIALRLFTSPDGSFSHDRDARSEQIAASLTRLQGRIGDLIPPFLHVPDAVWVGDSTYAAQVLPWAGGEPLLRFVSRHAHDASVLETLAQTVTNAVDRLESAGVTHGDLQHDNILVGEGGRRITLVDYDALYTPDLSGFAPPAEAGHANYQHPARTPANYGVPGGDRFAAAVICAGLRLVAAEPGVWETFAGSGGEGILFTAADFAAPEVSPVFQAANSAATRDDALLQAVAELENLCHEPGAITVCRIESVAPVAAPPVLPALPCRVSPKCAEEEIRPVSYLAPMRSGAFVRQEAAHLVALRGFLLLAPPTATLIWLWAWGAGGEKWPFLAYLFVLLLLTVATFLYQTWGAKKLHDALELEGAKLRSAERFDAEREKQLRQKQAAPAAKPEAWRERAHLRQVLTSVPLSRAIGDAGVAASTVRTLGEAGITTAAHLWNWHGFLPTGTNATDAALLRAWLGGLEEREKHRFACENDPAQAATVALGKIAERRAVRAVRLAELSRERRAFPDTSFAALLRRGVALRSPHRAITV